MNRIPIWLTLFLLISPACQEATQEAEKEGMDHRVTVKIDRLVTIVPAGASKRAMMAMARHPDGTIYLALQTDPPRPVLERRQWRDLDLLTGGTRPAPPSGAGNGREPKRKDLPGPPDQRGASAEPEGAAPLRPGPVCLLLGRWRQDLDRL